MMKCFKFSENGWEGDQSREGVKIWLEVTGATVRGK